MNSNIIKAYAITYLGEYDKMVKAIQNKEKIDPIIDDHCFTILDPLYPKCFLELKYPPLVLFYKGNLELLKEDKVAIVGSRNACEYSLKATASLCHHLKDKVIISGLAKGIDACAHRNANKTIGILGCGIDYLYPYENKDLFKRIEKEGLLLSEYPGLVKPLAYHFPFRNRLIVSLCQTLYVMQSRDKSGTMTSINEALSLGREIKVLPYDVFAQEGIQNNLLIHEGADILQKDEIAF